MNHINLLGSGVGCVSGCGFATAFGWGCCQSLGNKAGEEVPYCSLVQRKNVIIK